MTKNPTITLAMIAGGQTPLLKKNVEQSIARAINSAKSIIDEIIVIDTGCTKRTVATAKKYGATVLNRKWEGFSVARNQSIKASHSDWVLILDTDEELDSETVNLIPKAVKQAPSDVVCFWLHLFNVLPDGKTTFILHPRLFRREGLSYGGVVHNQPTYKNKPIETCKTQELQARLIHYGYGETPEIMAEKHERRHSMVKAWAESEPNNFMAQCYLVQTMAASRKMDEEAIKLGYSAIDMARKQNIQPKYLNRLHYDMLACLIRMGRADEILTLANQCLEFSPDYPDPHFFKIWAHGNKGQWNDVCSSAISYFEAHARAAQNTLGQTTENLTFERQSEALQMWIAAAKQCKSECACAHKEAA